MSKTILVPIPSNDFDPTETGVPWKILTQAGVKVVFATPNAQKASADPVMVTGNGLGLLGPLMKADLNGIRAYHEMAQSKEFLNPISYTAIQTSSYGGIILPGGHAPGMKEYLESQILQEKIAEFFASNLPVGAICHGVVLVSRSKRKEGDRRSVLYGKKTTALPKWMELLAWSLTCLWMGNYYRTYPQSVEDEVISSLTSPKDFLRGPFSTQRDSPQSSEDDLKQGFVVRDGQYLSARWPGDAHRFGREFLKLLG